LVVGTGHGPALQQAANTPTTTSSSTAPRPTVTVTRTVTAGPTGSAPAKGPASVTTAPGPEVLPVPRTFELASLTNAGTGHLVGLGSAACASGSCSAVVASDDDGRTWSTRASFTDLTTRGPLVTPADANQLVGVRFATPQVGYVFGGEVRRTTDGGRSWSPVDVAGRRVLSLETDGTRVWMVTARTCAHVGTASVQRGCSDLQVRTAPVTSDRTEAVDVPGTAPVVENAWLVLDGSDAYLNGTSTGTQQPLRPQRVSGTPQSLPVPQGCDPAQGFTVAAAANSRGTLVGLCPASGAADVRYDLVTSTDRGATWRQRPAPGLGNPTPAGVWLTATDAEHVVAVRQALPASTGEATSPTRMLSTSTGGAAWKDVAPGGSTSTTWAGAAGGGLVYATGGGASYWVSSDSGSTFETVPLRH
ncbi:hypothetical protein, partial [Pedococcus sp. 2YAF34]|uniref:hypothetical protein n=1 Tax=Pedococcus sp. 2YAF34 TaxID=3233032 RepID=UPI003F94AD0F